MGDLRDMREIPRDVGSGAPNALTSIPAGIHCAATDRQEEPPSDVDKIIVHNFLATLAEIALAVAQRRAERRKHNEHGL